MQIKPAEEEKHKWLHKLAIEPAYGRASISTSKLKLWEFLRVQIVAHYDCETRSPGLQWRCVVLCILISLSAHAHYLIVHDLLMQLRRVSSKWSRGQGKLGRKEKVRAPCM